MRVKQKKSTATKPKKCPSSFDCVIACLMKIRIHLPKPFNHINLYWNRNRGSEHKSRDNRCLDDVSWDSAPVLCRCLLGEAIDPTNSTAGSLTPPAGGKPWRKYASRKWRSIKEFPTKNVITFVVTVTGWGVDPNKHMHGIWSFSFRMGKGCWWS